MNDWKHNNFMHTSNPGKIGRGCMFFCRVGRCETMSVVSLRKRRADHILTITPCSNNYVATTSAPLPNSLSFFYISCTNCSKNYLPMFSPFATLSSVRKAQKCSIIEFQTNKSSKERYLLGQNTKCKFSG